MIKRDYLANVIKIYSTDKNKCLLQVETNQRYLVAYEAASGIHFKYKEVDIEAINLGETE